MRVRKSFMIVMLVALMLIPSTIAIAESQSNAPAQGVEIVAVCHVDGLDNFSPINIADPALDSHQAHGDAQPGDAVLVQHPVEFLARRAALVRRQSFDVRGFQS